MELLIGMLGAIIGIGLFVGGFFVGFKMEEKRNPVVEARQLTQEEIAAQRVERERLIEDQNAFKDLLGYNMDTAYMMGNSGKA